MTSARYCRGDNGPSASFTTFTSASTDTTRGSNVTIATPFLRSTRSTCARVTPGTSSSADRTATMQPSQSIPATANVTVADCGAVRQAVVQRAIVKKNWRLVIGVGSSSQSHHKTRIREHPKERGHRRLGAVARRRRSPCTGRATNALAYSLTPAGVIRIFGYGFTGPRVH